MCNSGSNFFRSRILKSRVAFLIWNRTFWRSRFRALWISSQNIVWNIKTTSKLDKSLFRRFSIRPNWVRPRKISVLYSLCFNVRAQSRAKSWIFNSIWVLLDVSCGPFLIRVGWVLSKTSSWSSSSISSSLSSFIFF